MKYDLEPTVNSTRGFMQLFAVPRRVNTICFLFCADDTSWCTSCGHLSSSTCISPHAEPIYSSPHTVYVSPISWRSIGTVSHNAACYISYHKPLCRSRQPFALSRQKYVITYPHIGATHLSDFPKIRRVSKPNMFLLHSEFLMACSSGLLLVDRYHCFGAA
jgi:hypothetical protein